MNESRIKKLIGLIYLLAAVYAFYKALDELNKPGFPYFPWLLFTNQVPLVKDILTILGLA